MRNSAIASEMHIYYHYSIFSLSLQNSVLYLDVGCIFVMQMLFINKVLLFNQVEFQ